VRKKKNCTESQLGQIVIISLFTDKNKSSFLESRLLFTQSEHFKKFSKSSDWLEKSRPSKKATKKSWSCKQAKSVLEEYFSTV